MNTTNNTSNTQKAKEVKQVNTKITHIEFGSYEHRPAVIYLYPSYENNQRKIDIEVMKDPTIKVFYVSMRSNVYPFTRHAHTFYNQGTNLTLSFAEFKNALMDIIRDINTHYIRTNESLVNRVKFHSFSGVKFIFNDNTSLYITTINADDNTHRFTYKNGYNTVERVLKRRIRWVNSLLSVKSYMQSKIDNVKNNNDDNVDNDEDYDYADDFERYDDELIEKALGIRA